MRPHVISSGGAIDRRRLQELFLNAAAMLSAHGELGFGDAVFDRTMFGEDTWQEYLVAVEHDLDYRVPTHGHLLPGSVVDLDAEDSFFDAEIEWSIAAQSKTTTYLLYVWPVVGGVSAFSLGDSASVDLIQCANPPGNYVAIPAGMKFPNGHDVSLGNHGVVSGCKGRGFTGLLAFSIAEWSIEDVQLQVRRLVR